MSVENRNADKSNLITLNNDIERNLNNNSRIDEFMIAEYNALQARALAFEQIKSSRINFFLIIVGASIAGYSGLSNIEGFIFDYPTILVMICLINLLIGVATLKFSMDQSIAITSFHRRAARVRRYFFDLNRELYLYYPFRPTDERPLNSISQELIIWRGGEPILIVLNALLIFFMFYTMTFQGFGLNIVSYLIALPMASLTIYGQLKYLQNNLKLRDKSEVENKKVNFPNSELIENLNNIPKNKI